MNRYVRSVTGGEPPVSSLEVDAAVSSPAELTLEEAEQLERLEPYGAGNPRPVFALLGATAEAVQPVGQGKHLKLRLSKGVSRFDAIFFSVTAEECGIVPGSRVDAAFYLQANTFRGNTTLQLQLVDVRPSLSPSRSEAAAQALVGRLVRGESLTRQELARLKASPSQYQDCWKALTELLRQGKARKERLPFLRSIAARIGGSESFLRAYLALAVFQERGLVSLTREGDWLAMYLMGDPENVTWDDCPYLLRLREKEAT